MEHITNTSFQFVPFQGVWLTGYNVDHSVILTNNIFRILHILSQWGWPGEAGHAHHEEGGGCGHQLVGTSLYMYKDSVTNITGWCWTLLSFKQSEIYLAATSWQAGDSSPIYYYVAIITNPGPVHSDRHI